MAADDPVILFSEFVDQFRQQETADNNEQLATTLEEQVDSLLSQSLKKYLTMDRSPSAGIELLIFDALVGKKEITRVGFGRRFDANCLPPLLNRLDEETLEGVALAGMPLSKSQATAIFEKMRNIGLRWFALYLREDYGSEIIHSFLHFLQESSVSCLALFCLPGDRISTEAQQSICTGILNSSVEFLAFCGLKIRGDNVEQLVHEILAEMILDSSSSIQSIRIVADDPGDLSLRVLSRCLRQHSVIRNLDISFRTGHRDDTLVFDRNPWWKRLLAIDDLPLKLWPLMLEKANTWKRDASHSHLDVLYFLLREKNTELLQNVRRRRIRKRKRYGFSA